MLAENIEPGKDGASYGLDERFDFLSGFRQFAFQMCGRLVADLLLLYPGLSCRGLSGSASFAVTPGDLSGNWLGPNPAISLSITYRRYRKDATHELAAARRLMIFRPSDWMAPSKKLRATAALGIS